MCRTQVYNSQYFRSTWEANWARYLNLLKSTARIKSWAYEPKTFKFRGIRWSPRFYTPDFRVVNQDDSVEFHEIKGWMDPRSIKTLRRMATHYPKIRIVLIQKDEYGAVARAHAHALSGWEWAPHRTRYIRERANHGHA
jgi:hypothetical protein